MNATNRGRAWGAWLGISVILACSGFAMGDRSDDPPPPREHDDAMFDREAMSARMQRRIDEMERELARLKEVKQRIDQGDPPPRMERPRNEGAHKGDLSPRERLRDGLERRRGMDERGPGPGGTPPKSGKDGSAPERMDYETLRPRLQEHAPGLVEVMDRLREQHREVADRVWQRMVPRFREASALRERDPQGFQLKLEELRTGLGVVVSIGELRQAKRQGEEPTIDARRAALREAVASQVDARIASQRHEIEALEGRVATLRQTLDEQVRDREKTIQERAQKMEEAPGQLGGDDGDPPVKPSTPQKR